MQTYKSVLTIAGSDSGGGAGVQADLKTFSALGCYGTCAITAITAQNTVGVQAVYPVPAAILQAQIRAVMSDIKPSAIKIGMIPSEESVVVIAETLREYESVPIIADPVMVASTGDQLCAPSVLPLFLNLICPLATLITPNIPEAAAITGKFISDKATMRDLTSDLLSYGSYAVLLKGGHMEGDKITSYYQDRNGNGFELCNPRIKSANTHGTGCTLSAAIAANIARGKSLEKSIKLAEQYVRTAINAGKCVKTGSGEGPLNHFFKPRKLSSFKVKAK